MGKYIINHEVDGFKKVDVTDPCLREPDNSQVIMLLDESTNDKLADYYEAVTQIILSGNKLCIIMLGTESRIRKALCNLSANYRNYNLYSVDSKLLVDNEYLETILEREPTYDEVQQFIGGDVAGYGELNVIMMGIEELCRRGDLDGLKNFVEQHINSIENLSSISDYLKKIADNSNSKELVSRIDDLKARVKESEAKVDNYEESNNKLRDENQRLSTANETAKAELGKALAHSKDLESQMSSKTPVISAYNELKLTLINCKVKNILYFKEISYVRYTNSLINEIYNVLSGVSKKRVKLLIYDSRAGLSGIYKPLNIVGGQEFTQNKQNYISSVDKFIVAEPNPIILKSILENNISPYEIVIVYDRLRQPTPIVSGNNVVTFYVINSNKDFEGVKQQLRITDTSNIITYADSSISQQALNIPTIADYRSVPNSGSAKTARYRKLQCERNNKQLMGTIFEKARISLN